MEQEKKHRKVLRSLFTKKANELDGLLLAEEKDANKINVCLQMLQSKLEELQVVDGRIYEGMLAEEDTTEEQLSVEIEACDVYKQRLLELQGKQNGNEPIASEVASCTSSSHSAASGKRKFKLPTLELKKFDDDIKNWLPFWAQFKKINDDKDIDLNDKIAYLSQATVAGSRARKIVDSFPPVPDNYEKIVDSLKARFGREDLQIEVYVRELLKLVLNRASLDSCSNISLLYDEIESQLRSLETLGITSDKYAAMLYPLIESCLPENLIRVYQRSSERSLVTSSTCNAAEDEPGDTLDVRLKGLMNFLRSEVENEQRFALAAEGFGIKASTHKDTELSGKRMKFKSERPKTSVATAAGLINCDVTKCTFCNGSHDNASCFKAQRFTLEQKKEQLAKNKACFRCLKTGHSARKCYTKVKCVVCGKSHVPLMCPELPVHKVEQPEEKKQAAQTTDQTLANYTSTQIFLQTLRVNLVGRANRQVRALCDTGSQRSYILQSTAKRMGYEPVREERIIHTLFGGKNTEEQKHTCYLIKVKGEGYTCSLEVLDQPIICNPVPYIPDGPWVNELKVKGVSLSDIVDDAPIEMLFGADIIGKLYTGRKFELKCGLFAIETLLGWTLMGQIPPVTPKFSSSMTVFSLFVKEAPITDLWKLDVLGIVDPIEKLSVEEQTKEFKELFARTTIRDKEGRYVVKLPWRDDHPPLSDNLVIAKKRLEYTVKKLKLSELIEQYDFVFKEWLNESIIEEVTEPQSSQPVHYLPHRPVIKESSLTTKIRPVFDASSHEMGKPSLNECLEVGPNLIALIPSILLPFRQQKIGVTADIRKAFLQIAVDEKDRDYLRFLWINASGDVKVFRHKRVVFGVTSSPFLLGATIDFHLSKCKENHMGQENYTLETIDKLASSFYVDNCLTSVPDQSALQKFIRESSSLMDEAKMDLRGWEYSGCSQDGKSVLILGLIWNVKEDTLSINTESLNSMQKVDKGAITKRVILSTTQRVFDPVGFTCPVTLQPKLILQQLWERKLGWDIPVDDETANRFKVWVQEISELGKVKIPRWICAGKKEADKWSLHTFSDASIKAYSAVVFLRVEQKDEVLVYLIAAKARVAPLKKITMPRLELLGATIAARLYNSVKSYFTDTPAYFWSDSTTVLSWIRRSEEWSVFVKNRVKEIRDLTLADRWNHVSGVFNPADLPSRGCNTSQLLEARWWEGPSWLYEDDTNWPKDDWEVDEDHVNVERRKTAITMFHSTSVFWNLHYFSKFIMTVRMIAWIRRFCFNCRNPLNKLQGTLTVKELTDSEDFVLKIIQGESFEDRDPRLSSLKPFRDESGLIRLRSQVSQRPDLNDFRFPIVLPGKHPTVQKLIMGVHKEACHVGTQGLLGILRERYWILGGRRVLRSVLSQCGICKRYSSKPIVVESPALPMDRVRDGIAFEVTGVDFAGPLFLKSGRKAWICLFTCAIYRAVHLELVTSLSTLAFIQALRRFVARRGRPSIVYSDNGTNFVGLHNACKKLDWSAIADFSSARQIQWRFNPPTAAWWGGFWERLIGVIKRLLRKVLGRACLTYEDLLTVLCECESVVNSRPLTYVSNESQDLMPLTPAMFLREQIDASLPDADIIERSSPSRKARYRQKLLEDLRKRFRVEYLAQLKPNSARQNNNGTLSPGDIVIVSSGTEKRMDWPLGRIVELVTGKDGKTRLVKVQTAQGQLLRPVQRLYPLESVMDTSLDPKNAVSSSSPATCSRTGEEVCVQNCDSAGVTESRASDKSESGVVDKRTKKDA